MRVAVAAVALGSLWLGCEGVIGAPSARGGGGRTRSAPPGAGAGALVGGGLPASDVPYLAPAAAPAELRARVWRVSHAEYAKAVKDFVGATIDVSGLEQEIDNGVYPNMSASGLVRVTLANGYYMNAERIADELTVQQLTALNSGRKLEAAAKMPFLQAAVQRAFRRPATAEDIAPYAEIFDLGAATATDGSGSFRAVVRALLTSPFFVYRTEIGADSALEKFALTHYEIASLLSFSLLGGPPSADLLAAADRGELSDPTLLAKHIATLLAQPEAAVKLGTFLTEWLKIHHFSELDKDATIFPGFEAIRPAMLDEAAAFLNLHGSMTGTLASLLTSPVTLMPSGALGKFYGSEPSAAGAVGTRTGVLGLGAVIAARAKPNVTSPTLRGLFVRERLLCQEIHLPPNLPPDIIETLRRSMPRTTRELYELHAGSPACASCHSMLDPVGFNFEDFDAAGRFRLRENGVAIDSRGELLGADVGGAMANHTDLANALSRSEWVRECMARQAFRFYFGRVEVDRGVPAVQAGRRAIGTGSFRDMLSAIMSSPTLSLRVRN